MIEEDEVSNGHWVARAALYTMPDEDLVAPVGIDSWSTGRITWAADGGVSIELRRYPGDVPGVTVEIDLNRQMPRLLRRYGLPASSDSLTSPESSAPAGDLGFETAIETRLVL